MKREQRPTQDEMNLTLKLLDLLEISIKSKEEGYIVYHNLINIIPRDRDKKYIMPMELDEFYKHCYDNNENVCVIRPLHDSFACELLVHTFMNYIEPDIHGYALENDKFYFYDIDNNPVGQVYMKKEGKSINLIKVAAMLYVLEGNIESPEVTNYLR